jgi:hypothetical protein
MPKSRTTVIHGWIIVMTQGLLDKGILKARAAIPKQDLFFETPSPSSRSSRSVIFHEAGSHSRRVQTE